MFNFFGDNFFFFVIIFFRFVSEISWFVLDLKEVGFCEVIFMGVFYFDGFFVFFEILDCLFFFRFVLGLLVNFEDFIFVFVVNLV